MSQVDLLLERLAAIGQSLAQSEHGLALLGLGSVGIERARMDEYSDLDFFAIVAPGHKHDYLRDLGWLSCIRPVAYAFMNTVDGYKLLFDDGIFCEMAVFEPDELAHIPYAEGQIVWQASHFTLDIRIPQRHDVRQPSGIEWLLGEALTNLYVGLARERRGEKLSAQRLIQHYAVDRILELAPHIEAVQPALADAFAPERRFEQLYPQTAAQLPGFIQGYDGNRASAKAILGFLAAHFEVNAAIHAEIIRLCE
ncbi:MAG: hypothetical protein H7Y11_13495 [Armatimonadetes bacterium]|nr:hypothetical protein [Anaerolineae bacterium]